MREAIKLKNVSYSALLSDGIGYIKQDGFTEGAANEVKDALVKLKAEGANKLILDLRGNGGGLMNEAVKIVNLFVNKGLPVVSMKGKVQDRNQSFSTQNEPVDRDIPIVVLIDRASASASEIVAGALQDLDRAVIVGQRSFGKGLVQNIVPLEYNAQLKITTAKYYIPSGRCVQALNYADRDEEGRAKKVPDSLRTAYKTQNGRTVYDGDGIEPDIEDVDRAQKFLDSVAKLIRDSVHTFQEAAELFSDDPSGRVGGIYTGPYSGNARVTAEEMDPSIFFVIDKFEIGDVSNAAICEIGEERSKETAARIVMLKARIAPHKANLDSDYDKIYNMAMAQAREKTMKDWLDKKLKSLYVRLSDKSKECTFQYSWGQ